MTENDKNWKKFQEIYSSGYLFDPKEDKEDLESEVLMAETTKEAELMLRGYILNEIREVWKQGIKAFTEFDKLVDMISTTTEFKLGAKPVYKTDSWIETQSKIAIGSGGVFGKGFLKGTQTGLNFVPIQSTDFIFSVIGEEFGYFGSMIFLILYIIFLYRILMLSENQKDKFARVFGYSTFSIFLFHFTVNVSMTLGLFPVIGIPLSLISYGGSSLLSFSLLLFVFLKLDSVRPSILAR